MANRKHVVLSSLSWDAVSPEFLTEWSFLISSVIQRALSAQWDIDVSLHYSWSSLLPMARNRAIVSAQQSFPNYTHLLFVDSDVMGLRCEHVKRMLDHDKDIVAACVPLGSDPHHPACEHDDDWKAVYDELAKPQPGLVRRRWVGTGCVLIRREVFAATAITSEQPDGQHGHAWFVISRCLPFGWQRRLQKTLQRGTERIVDALENPGCRPGDLAAILQDVWSEGWAANQNGMPSGEDVEFGERAARAGFASYIDCGVQLRHLVSREVEVSADKRLALPVVDHDDQSLSVRGPDPDYSAAGVRDGAVVPVDARAEGQPVDG